MKKAKELYKYSPEGPKIIQFSSEILG